MNDPNPGRKLHGPAERQFPSPARLVGVLLFLLWVTLIIAGYYVVHKPWGSGQPAGLALALVDCALAAGLAAVAGGLGTRLLRRFTLDDPLEAALLAAGLGLGLVGLALLGVGLAGLFSRWAAYLGLAAALIWLRRDTRTWLQRLGRLFQDRQAWSRLERGLWAFVLFVLALNLLRALAPPVKWDSLVYHLQLPRLYVEHGRLYFTPENLYGGFPQVAEMWFTWALALRSGSTAAVFGWVVGALAYAAVEALARRVTPGAPHWLAPAVLLSGFSFAQSLYWAYVDLFVMLFGAVLWLRLLAYLQDGRRGDLALAGLLAGFAIGTKYSSLLLVLLAGLVLLADARQRRLPLKRAVRDGLLLAVLAGGAALPWGLKNWLLAGNPLYPVVSLGQAASPWQQSFASGPRPQRTLLDDLVLPVDVTLFGVENGAVSGRPAYAASQGALLLALAPGLLLGWSGLDEAQRRRYRLMLVAAGGAWVLWALAGHFADELIWPRHYYGVFPLLAALAAGGFQSAAGVSLPGVRIGRVLTALTVLALLLAALTELDYQAGHDPLPVLLGKQSEQVYLQNELGAYAYAVEAVNRLPEQAVVWNLWEPRVYYCRPECISDGRLRNWITIYQAGGGIDETARLLRERGVTHVLVYDAGLELLVVAGSPDLPDLQPFYTFRDRWLTDRQELVSSYSLYTLRAP